MAGDWRLGFLGAGQMARALARGFIQAGRVRPDQVVAADVAPAACAAFEAQTAARTLANNREVAAQAEVLVLAVKPAQALEVLAEVAPQLTPNPLLVSIAAGVALARLEAALPAGTRVVRVMPNTPVLVGAGATAFALGRAATRPDAEQVERLFSAVGWAVEVPEAWMDAITGLSGSGPAYVFQVIEALSDGGVAAGLPRELATRLAAQTVLGAAQLVRDSGQHPAVLKDQVTSPGGTTIEGLQALEEAGVRAAFINAVRAAAEKSRRLGAA